VKLTKTFSWRSAGNGLSSIMGSTPQREIKRGHYPLGLQGFRTSGPPFSVLEYIDSSSIETPPHCPSVIEGALDKFGRRGPDSGHDEHMRPNPASTTHRFWPNGKTLSPYAWAALARECDPDRRRPHHQTRLTSSVSVTLRALSADASEHRID
jgi:hypothetical protein